MLKGISLTLIFIFSSAFAIDRYDEKGILIDPMDYQILVLEKMHKCLEDIEKEVKLHRQASEELLELVCPKELREFEDYP